ncbi:ATP-binding protein [Aeromonas sp. L_1B5_3]|uniref:ATP-binding protein n=1 Tax=Aeromonas sp. L_1B5_3 TaxID=1588629 RepID=UPI000AAD354D|nr:ATP-binding protein [Aeromonas sp. L_1B5_3]
MTHPVTSSDIANIENTLGDLNRAANASIRGYLTQIAYTALQWVNLCENEVLVVEGREDLDRFILSSDGTILDVSETQLKDLTDAVNVRSDAVWESIFNFLLSYKYHKEGGRNVRMVFATTASLKTQKTSSSTGIKKVKKQERLDLEIDVISTWSSLLEQKNEKLKPEVEKLTAAINALFNKYLKPKISDDDREASSAEKQYAKDVQVAIGFQEDNKSWTDFFTSVSWITDLRSASGIEEQLKTTIEAEPSMSKLPASEFAQILIYQVLLASSKSEVSERILTRACLQELTSRSVDELRDWATRNGLIHLETWQQHVEKALSKQDERLEHLECTVATVLPSHEKAWTTIKKFTDLTRQRIRNTIGDIHLERTEQLNALEKNLIASKTVMILGASGAGKSALVRTYTENLDSQNGLTLWLGGSSLERPDLLALNADLNLGMSFDQVFEYNSNSKLLVLDGLDRVFEISSLSIVSDLLNILRVNKEDALCELIVTCQTQDWPHLEERLHDVGIDTSGWALYECEPPSHNELSPIWDSIPKIRRIAQEPHLAPLLQNLKVLDLIASQINRSGYEDPLVGENSVASWFWQSQVLSGRHRHRRNLILMRIAEMQADTLRLSIPMTDLPSSEIAIVEEFESNGILIIDEYSNVLFAHDLFADWARLRLLQSKEDYLLEFLQSRIDSPLWLRAIRLLGIELLDTKRDVQDWKILLRSLQEIGGGSTADLLLDSIVFALDSKTHLELLKDELLSDDSDLLRRLLKRFLAFATLPDPRMKKVGKLLGLKDADISCSFRYPNWPYWPAVLEFLYAYREQISETVPNEICKVAKLWLEHTKPQTRYRREVGEIGILLGELALSAYTGRQDQEFSATDFFILALSGIPECEKEVVEFALKASERTTKIKSESHRNFYDFSNPYHDLEYKHSEDAPNNEVNNFFRSAVLVKRGLKHLIRHRPEVAREVILSCLFTPKSCIVPYASSSREWEADFQSIHSWPTPSHFRGPFLDLLKANFAEGAETIFRIIDHVSEQWLERRIYEGNKTSHHIYDSNSLGSLEVDVGGVKRTLSGDGRTLGWSAGLGSPLPNSIITSALMALEQHLYSEIGSDDIQSMLNMILERTRSVPLLHVLLDVGRKEPNLFTESLMPLLGVAELYTWEIQLRVQGRTHLNMASPQQDSFSTKIQREFNSLSHRSLDLRDIACSLFFTNENVSAFLQKKVIEWKEIIRESQPCGNRERLSQIVDLFTKENYIPIPSEDGVVRSYRYTPPKAEEKQSDQFNSLLRTRDLILYQSNCRRFIDEGKSMSTNELEAFVQDLKNIKEIWQNDLNSCNSPEKERSNDTFDQFDIPNLSANALCGGIAVLLCLHIEWVKKQSDLSKWCQGILTQLILTPPPHSDMDSHENSSNWEWDCFAAEAIVALWQQEPEDLELRQLVARLAFSFHNEAVAILVRNVQALVPSRHSDLLRLRRLIFECAYARRQCQFIARIKRVYSVSNDGKIEQFNSALQQWYLNLIEDFVSGSLDASLIDWECIGNKELLSNFSEMELLNRNDYLDFELLIAAHKYSSQLTEGLSEEEREYSIDFFKSSLSYIIKTLEHSGSDYFETYPSDGGIWLLEKLALAVSVMKPEENPEYMWDKLLSFPSKYHHWAETFLKFYYTSILQLETMPRYILNLSIKFIEAVSKLPQEHSWNYREDVWLALYGVHSSTLESWKPQHSDLASSLWPLMKVWLSQELNDAKQISSVARWLKSDAATHIRFDSLGSLNEVVKLHSNGWSGSELESAENAIAKLLLSIWESEPNALRRSEAMRTNFQFLLRWLADNQHQLGLELTSQIGRL